MMNRKHFLGTTGTLLANAVFPEIVTAAAQQYSADKVYKKPPYLKPGDTIGITSPAGYITLQDLQPAITVMQSWGYQIKTGTTIDKRDFTFGGTDEERLQDFQSMLNDDEIKAIMCARGGYGSVRIIDGLQWEKFKRKPKWVIGFSDITVLHNHIHRNLKIASIHSKMCNSFPDNWTTAEPVQVETILSIKYALEGIKMQYTAIPNAHNKTGTAQGILIGGNLKTIESLSGSASDINTAGKILFVEDTGEYLYSIDRMFWNLKRTGKLSSLKALIVGGFKVKPDDEGEEFGKTLEDMVLEKVEEYHYPVCFDFPVGHQPNNYALKCGVQHRLQVTTEEVLLTEII